MFHITSYYIISTYHHTHHVRLHIIIILYYIMSNRKQKHSYVLIYLHFSPPLITLPTPLHRRWWRWRRSQQSCTQQSRFVDARRQRWRCKALLHGHPRLKLCWDHGLLCGYTDNRWRGWHHSRPLWWLHTRWRWLHPRHHWRWSDDSS